MKLEEFISETEIEKLLEEAKAEALEMVKSELKAKIAGIIRKKAFEKIALGQQISDADIPCIEEEDAPVEEKTPPRKEIIPVGEAISARSNGRLRLTAKSNGRLRLTVKPSRESGPSIGAVEEQVPSVIEDETIKEIERIKSQIARNEELLRQAKAQAKPPPDSDLLGESDDAPTPDGDGFYVYCVTNELESDIGEEINVKGIDGRNPVFPVSSDGLSAVVSRVPLSEFNEAAIIKKASGGDLSWFDTKSRHHELVIRSIMAKNTVVPMKFCTLYTSEENILQFLEEHKGELRESLDYFEGKSEWGVKAYCDVGKLAENKEQSGEGSKSAGAPRLRRDKLRHPDNRGAAYLAKRKQEISMEKEARQLMYDMSQEIHDRLAKFAVESRRNDLLDSKATGKENPMMLNAAYLIEQSKLEAFNDELAKIQEEKRPDGYELETSGPWPPYNFVKRK